MFHLLYKRYLNVVKFADFHPVPQHFFFSFSSLLRGLFSLSSLTWKQPFTSRGEPSFSTSKILPTKNLIASSKITVYKYNYSYQGSTTVLKIWIKCECPTLCLIQLLFSLYFNYFWNFRPLKKLIFDDNSRWTLV